MRDAVVKDLMRDAIVKNDLVSYHEGAEWAGVEDHRYGKKVVVQKVHKDKSEACVEYGTCKHIVTTKTVHHGYGWHDDLMRDAVVKNDNMRDAIVKDLMRDAVVKNDNMRDAVVKDLMRDAIVKDLMRDAVVKN